MESGIRRLSKSHDWTHEDIRGEEAPPVLNSVQTGKLEGGDPFNLVSSDFDR